MRLKCGQKVEYKTLIKLILIQQILTKNDYMISDHLELLSLITVNY